MSSTNDLRKDDVAKAWASYREQVVPAAAGSTQVQECQRAFYAGAQAMLFLIVHEPETTQGAYQIAEFAAELTAFARRQGDLREPA